MLCLDTRNQKIKTVERPLAVPAFTLHQSEARADINNAQTTVSRIK